LEAASHRAPRAAHHRGEPRHAAGAGGAQRGRPCRCGTRPGTLWAPSSRGAGPGAERSRASPEPDRGRFAPAGAAGTRPLRHRVPGCPPGLPVPCVTEPSGRVGPVLGRNGRSGPRCLLTSVGRSSSRWRRKPGALLNFNPLISSGWLSHLGNITLPYCSWSVRA